jgi:hypothetical protein
MLNDSVLKKFYRINQLKNNTEREYLWLMIAIDAVKRITLYKVSTNTICAGSIYQKNMLKHLPPTMLSQLLAPSLAYHHFHSAIVHKILQKYL